MTRSRIDCLSSTLAVIVLYTDGDSTPMLISELVVGDPETSHPCQSDAEYQMVLFLDPNWARAVRAHCRIRQDQT
jgi:hypothetical protein